MKTINAILSTDFKNNYVIGFQIRTFYLNINVDLNSFIECGLEIEKNRLSSSKVIKWCVSSDSEQTNQYLKQKYPEKIIFGEGLVGHIAEQNKGYSRAIIDVELLSKTDILITTGGSTFGFVSSIKSNRMNYVVNSGKKCHLMSMRKPGFTHSGDAVFN